MCGRFAIGRSAQALADDLGAVAAPSMATWQACYDVTPDAEAPVLVEVPERRLGLARFGLHEPGGRVIFNARAESLSERPLFAEAAARRRCLVPVDGFFEWERRGAHRIPHFVHAAVHHADGGRELLLLAGLYEVAHDETTGERRTRFVIVTAPAVAPVERIHDRMPLVVPRGLMDSWLLRGALDVEAALAAIASATPVPLGMHAVSRRLGRMGHDDPRVIEPVDPDAEATGLLDFGDDALDVHAPRRTPR
jgi:putative SOS response-associated peptidase YedK